MGLKTKAAEAALELATNENVLDKTVGLFGMLFPYLGTTKKTVDTYMSEIQNSDLSPDVKARLMLSAKSDLKRWKNQESIADIAFKCAKEGTDFSENSGVNEDWLDRYMDSAKFVSSEDMQLIWGKILANEFEAPGSTPLNMIRILSEITSDLANAFRIICSMTVKIKPLDPNEEIENDQAMIVPYNGNKNIFDKIGLSFGAISELEALGLIKFDGIVGYVIDCHEGLYEICIDKNTDKIQNNTSQLNVGNVMLTKAGETLQKITEPIEIEEYYLMLAKYLMNKGVVYISEKLLFNENNNNNSENTIL